MSALIGYCRTSTVDQNLDLQLDALRNAGCDRTFSDQLSGKSMDRPGLKSLLDYARPGDTVVVWKLDRLGRSITQLLATIALLEEKRIEFRSLTENIDTSTPSGRLVLNVLASLADYERALIIERTKAGLASARQRGRVPGRPKAVCDAKLAAIRAMEAQGKSSKEICEAVNVSRSTYYRVRE